jgi:hypothetical protein
MTHSSQAGLASFQPPRINPADLNAAKAAAWLEGHAAGRDYQGDGWNADAHDPNEDNPYRSKEAHA